MSARSAINARLTEEQARIARELHDVIAHNVSVMVLQAAGGREVFDADPARARAALASIETTGREALAELRRLLGVARAGEDGASVAPQPGLSGLETARRAGARRRSRSRARVRG